MNRSSEWRPVKGVEFLGALPADIQEFTSVVAGLGKSTNLEATRCSQISDLARGNFGKKEDRARGE